MTGPRVNTCVVVVMGSELGCFVLSACRAIQGMLRAVSCQDPNLRAELGTSDPGSVHESVPCGRRLPARSAAGRAVLQRGAEQPPFLPSPCCELPQLPCPEPGAEVVGSPPVLRDAQSPQGDAVGWECRRPPELRGLAQLRAHSGDAVGSGAVGSGTAPVQCCFQTAAGTISSHHPRDARG